MSFKRKKTQFITFLKVNVFYQQIHVKQNTNISLTIILILTAQHDK